MTLENQPTRTFVPDHFALAAEQRETVDRVAKTRFDGNRSMAARYIITHFANCQSADSNGKAAPDEARPEPAR